MNRQEIDLYTKLSKMKIYGERFGEWKEMDAVVIISDPLLKPEKGMIINLYTGEDVTVQGRFGHGVYGNVSIRITPNSFWLPPVFDPGNPGRCLWGMVDWDNAEIGGVWPGGFVGTFKDNRDRLDFALIKTILKQEGSHE